VTLRRSAPANETDKEYTDGKANGKPDCGQLQNIRTMKPVKRGLLRLFTNGGIPIARSLL